MPERLTREEVAHVAHLARLEVTEAELDTFTDQLADILEHANDVEALDAGRGRHGYKPKWGRALGVTTAPPTRRAGWRPP